jgi:hypothetical protein
MWTSFGKGLALAAIMVGIGGAPAHAASASTDKIIISGASGQLGELVVKELLARGVAPANLILVSRTPAKLEEFRKLGASVRFGDVDQPDSLPAAYAGGTRMLMISLGGVPGTQLRPPRHKLAFDAAVKAGVKHHSSAPTRAAPSSRTITRRARTSSRRAAHAGPFCATACMRTSRCSAPCRWSPPARPR